MDDMIREVYAPRAKDDALGQADWSLKRERY